MKRLLLLISIFFLTTAFEPIPDKLPQENVQLARTNILTIGGGVTASTPASLSFATGNYTGSGSGQSITSVGFQPDFVIIFNNGNYGVCARFPDETGSNSVTMQIAGAEITTGITSFDANGFTVGNNDVVDHATTTYTYMAFKDNGAGDFAHNTYIGNGIADRQITTGFHPDLVILRTTSNQTGGFGYWRNSAFPEDYSVGFVICNPSLAAIRGDFSNNYFEVGGDLAAANKNDEPYVWVALKAVAGKISSGYYAVGATEDDDRNITDVPGFTGITPTAAWIFAYTNGNDMGIRCGGIAGDVSYRVSNVSESNAIQSFISGGFQIGTSNRVSVVNCNSYYTAFKE